MTVDNLILVILFIAATVVAGFLCYVAWFRPEVLRDIQRQVFKIEKILPYRSPFPRARRAFFESHAWIWWIRVTHTVLFLMFLSVFLLIGLSALSTVFS